MRTLRLAVWIAPFIVVGCNTTECAVDNPNRGNLIATGPSIDEISVQNATHGAPVSIHAVLRTPPIGGMVDDGVAVHVRSTRRPGLAFGPTLPMEETSSSSYERSLYQLNFGPYEACVMADFKPAPALEPVPPVITTYTDRLEFFVGPAEPCQQWSDAASGEAGWTFGGIFDVNGGQPVPPAGYAPSFSRTDYGLTVLTGPLYTAESSDDLWRFDLNSPDLSNDADWQGLSEVALRVATGTDVIVWAQPIFSYEYDDGSIHTFAPVDDDGDWIFYELSGTDTFYAPTMRPGSVPLTQIQVRIFGAYYVTSPEFFVHLQLLCPLPSRLSSVIGVYLGELAAAQGKSASKLPAPGRP